MPNDTMAQRVATQFTAARVEQVAKRRVQQSPMWKTLDDGAKKRMLNALNDPLYAAVFASTTKPEMDKAMATLRSIRSIRNFAHMRKVIGI